MCLPWKRSAIGTRFPSCRSTSTCALAAPRTSRRSSATATRDRPAPRVSAAKTWHACHSVASRWGRRKTLVPRTSRAACDRRAADARALAPAGADLRVLGNEATRLSAGAGCSGRRRTLETQGVFRRSANAHRGPAATEIRATSFPSRRLARGTPSQWDCERFAIGVDRGRPPALQPATDDVVCALDWRTNVSEVCCAHAGAEGSRERSESDAQAGEGQ
jgi:hypothetical protein